MFTGDSFGVRTVDNESRHAEGIVLGMASFYDEEFRKELLQIN